MKPALVKPSDPPRQRPSLGRVVHYTTRDPSGAIRVHVALITAIHDGEAVSLVVFPPPFYAAESPAPTYAELEVARSEVPAGTPGAVRKWAWPVFVPPDPPKSDG